MNKSAMEETATTDATPSKEGDAAGILARNLAQMMVDQAASPWATLVAHIKLALLQGAARLPGLTQKRREKLKRQIAKRDPARFLSVAMHADRQAGASGVAVQMPTAQPLAAPDFKPYDPALPDPSPDVRAIAFYLPQFHPFPENDAWWGKGFTEWTNVGKARPLFPGHYQPHCPIHLGYYDLRLPEVMVEQARIARQYAISGFAYHFYWFAGKTLMEHPLRTMLGNPAVDMPFFLSWANENWTRRWDGRDEAVLIKQNYSPDDTRAMMRHISEYMRDPRYIRVNGRAVFSVYRPRQIPDLAATVDIWRDEARRQGVGELYLIGIQRSLAEDHRQDGFDANLEFTPHGIEVTELSALLPLDHSVFRGKVHDYDASVAVALAQEDAGLARHRCAMLGWDNTARSPDRATIHLDFKIKTYQDWVTELCRRARSDAWRSPDERLVFINAWNEWAEGTHLEPDQRYGFAYLDATRQAVLGP